MLDINKIRSRLTTLKTQTQKQDSLWKPSAGKSVIRILPYQFNKENPFIELLFHYQLGGKSYLSPKTFGRPDPVIELSERLKSTGDKEQFKQAKQLEPKLRTFVPIVVRGEEQQGVKFWGFGKTVYQDLLSIIADADYGDITDTHSGRDITVEFKTAAETGKSFPTTSIRVKPNITPLTDDAALLDTLLNSQRNILDIYKEPTYDDLMLALDKWAHPEKYPDEGKNGQGAKDDASVEVDVDEAPAPAPATKVETKTKPSAKAPVAGDMAAVQAQFDHLFNKKSN